MPRAKSFDEEAVLNQAMELFQEQGYEATSLSDLESRLGLGRQSLYNTFGDKQALFLKALERYRRSVVAVALAGLNTPGAGLQAIRDYFRSTVATLVASAPAHTCLVASTIVERGTQDADSLLQCNLSRAELERSFRRALARAKSRGELVENLDVEATASMLVVQTYGLNVLAKSGATAGELSGAVEALLAGLK